MAFKAVFPRLRQPRRARLAPACLLVIWFTGCDDRPSAPTVGSNSNWLKACSAEAPCAAPTTCRCGACTADCSVDADCSGLANAVCAPGNGTSAWAICQTDQPALTQGICLPRCEPGACIEGQACVGGQCVLVSLPAVDFCVPVVSRPEEARREEEEFLEQLQTTRTAGGVTCGTNGPAPAAPPLRLDTRLVCAARVLATELDQGLTRSLIDSQGRGTQQRMTLVGYAWTAWGEAYQTASSATQAMQAMLADADGCTMVTTTRIRDIAVGRSGNIYVVTVGAER
jgi:hypothetical protein